MKKYTVIWETSHKVTIEAINEDTACEIVMNGDYNENLEDIEITTPLTAYETK